MLDEKEQPMAMTLLLRPHVLTQARSTPFCLASISHSALHCCIALQFAAILTPANKQMRDRTDYTDTDYFLD